MRNPISPKVTASSITGILLFGVLTVLQSVSPETLEFAGDYQGALGALIASLGAALAGYLKVDPDRVPAYSDLLGEGEEDGDDPFEGEV